MTTIQHLNPAPPAATGQAASLLAEKSAVRPGRLLRRPEVEAMTGLKRSSLYAGMRAGTFPQCVYISERSVAWPESQISAWVAQRVQRRQAAGAAGAAAGDSASTAPIAAAAATPCAPRCSHR